MREKSRIVPILVFISILTAFFYGQFRNYRYEKELRKDGKITIGRVDSIKRLPKWSNIYISYYIKDSRYLYYENDLDANITKKDIGNFYEIKYLPSSPEIIRANYSKQITDTAAILKAGFSREEIEGK